MIQPWQAGMVLHHIQEPIMARENAVFETTINAEEKTISFKVVGNGNVHVFNMDKTHAANVAYAALHGFKQRLVDNTAISKTNSDGTIRSAATMAQMREEALLEMIQHYESGVERWNVREPGKGGGNKKPVFDIELVIRAAMALTSKDYATIRAHIERRAKSASCTMAAIAEAWVGQDARLGAKVAELRAAQADPSLSEGLLDELMDGNEE